MTLFTPVPASAHAYAGVALEQGIDRVLDYAVPKRLAAITQIGQRVRVPLGRGNRPAHGYIVSIKPTTDHPPDRIKEILAVEDDRVLVPPPLMELSRWMARYYASPLGVVLQTAIPAAVKHRIGLGYSRIVYPAQEPAKIQEILEKTRAPKRRAILARLLLMEKDHGVELVKLAGEAGVRPPTVAKLAAAGLIQIRSEPDLPRLTGVIPDAASVESPIQLNADQKSVFDNLEPRLFAGFSVNLLHGVTGSGKTEIYLQCIAQVLARRRRALVMVPEISLTPQTLRRFLARFPRVAVLHSGLSATQRHRAWQQIRQGDADIVIGARSAIFAPLPDLGIIIVDEEHDAGYKQDQIPRYHARDIAIKRAQIAGIPIILGSATPSLEMYYRCTAAPPDPRYTYLTLPRRVRGLAMPTIEIVDMHQEIRLRRARGVHLISQRLQRVLTETLAAKHQAIILLNRRGYANFVHCPSCGHVMQCKYCDATMTYHRSAETEARDASFAHGIHTGQLHCHYCLAVNSLPSACPVCGKKLSLFGLGTQRVQEELAKKFPDLRMARVDSDSMQNVRDYESTLAKFASGEIQVMLGTQMIAKGLDYPNVTLVGIISADTALALTDFRAAERTFQLLTQAAGRSGRGDSPGRVIVQTFQPDNPAIRAAITQNFPAFAASEFPHRRQVGLPPYTRIVRIILRSEDLDDLHKIATETAAHIAAAVAAMGPTVPIKIAGPMPCPIARIAGFHRHQIVLYSPTPDPLQKILATIREAGALRRADRIAVDVDPVSLL